LKRQWSSAANPLTAGAKDAAALDEIEGPDTMIHLRVCFPILLSLVFFWQVANISGEDMSGAAPPQREYAVRCLIVTGEDYPGHKSLSQNGIF